MNQIEFASLHHVVNNKQCIHFLNPATTDNSGKKTMIAKVMKADGSTLRYIPETTSRKGFLAGQGFSGDPEICCILLSGEK
ncbi:MAG: hypothetical protein LBG28_03115 [Tannerella sp.]|jgi:hypothetical protein|nr:hypothetical protein [Tannerella sp.]